MDQVHGAVHGHQYSMAVSNTTGPEKVDLCKRCWNPERKMGVATHFFEIISLNLAQKPLYLVGTILHWMQLQHEMPKCNLLTYRCTVNFTVELSRVIFRIWIIMKEFEFILPNCIWAGNIVCSPYNCLTLPESTANWVHCKNRFQYKPPLNTHSPTS